MAVAGLGKWHINIRSVVHDAILTDPFHLIAVKFYRKLLYMFETIFHMRRQTKNVLQNTHRTTETYEKDTKSNNYA